MGKILFNLLLKEFTECSNKLEAINEILSCAKSGSDQEDYCNFMSSLLNNFAEKLQKKMEKEKLSNEKIKFITSPEIVSHKK